MPVGKSKQNKPSTKERIAELCRELDKKVVALADFKAKHKKVLGEHDELQESVATTQEQIKKLCHEAYLNKPRGEHKVYAGAGFEIVATAMRSRIFDEERMLKEIGDKLEELGAIVEEHVVPRAIDKKVLDNAVHKKLIDKALVEKYVTEGEPKTPSVSFRNPQQQKPEE